MPTCNVKSPLSADPNKRCFKVDDTHRFNMAMQNPVSVKGCDWTFSYWFMSALNGTANSGTDWAFVYSNRGDSAFEVDTDHRWDAGMSCIPTFGYYTRPWKTKVCDQSWHQIMLCHLASTNMLYGFVDGNLENVVTGDGSITGTSVAIGGYSAERNYYTEGYLDDMYLIKDTCLHTESFKLDTIYATDLLNTRKTWYDVPSKKLYGFK